MRHSASQCTCVALFATGTGPRTPRTVLVDEQDIKLVAGESLYMHSVGYPVTTGPVYLHHTVMAVMRKDAPMPPGMSIDHINWTKTDNRRAYGESL